MKDRAPIMVVLILAVVSAMSQQQPSTQGSTPSTYASEKANQCARKFQYVQSNGAAKQPDPKPTVINEDEINAYFAQGGVQLPKGVQSVRFAGTPNVVTAHARVDFDQLTAGSRSMNPLLALFTGVHDIVAVADANGVGGTAVVHVRSVSLDGTTIPRAALEFFVDRYVKPKHPEVGLDTRFQMPHRIDTAEVGEHTLTLKQK